MLPLHQDAKKAEKKDSSHAGLWYDRFFDGFLPNAKKPDDKTEKEAWAAAKSSWVKHHAKEVGSKDALQTYTDRQSKVIAACGGQTMVLRSQWHFVTGLGNNHPVENGFAWHHTLGVPYLTGAAVKGMVRAWCEVWEGFDDAAIKQWFGDTEQSGELMFFDAVPIKPVQLKADMMTPHYGDWYAKGDTIKDAANEPEKVPADWHDPNPISFLVVDKGQAFQFGVAKRPNSNIDLSKVVDALTKALEHLGAGAKTSAGYGRFAEDMQAKAKREKAMREQAEAEEKARIHAEQEAKRAAMSPLEAELDRWLASNPEPNTVATWLQDIEARPASEQQQIASVLKQYYEARGTWKKPSKKQKPNVQKIKAILNPAP